jgi:hypothetical protein
MSVTAQIGGITYTVSPLVAAVHAYPAAGHATSGYINALANLARGIREAVPISGECAANAECRDRRALVDEALNSLGIVPGERHWYTVITEDKPEDNSTVFGGVWAQSFEEAVLETVIWRVNFDHRHIMNVVIDDETSTYDELRAAARQVELDDARRARHVIAIAETLTLFDLDATSINQGIES